MATDLPNVNLGGASAASVHLGSPDVGPAVGTTRADGERFDRPGVVRRLAWWVLGPAVTTAMLALSLLMTLAPPLGVDATRADARAVVLLLVAAGALLARRRWPLWATLTAAGAMVVSTALAYPPTVLLIAPSICMATSLHRSSLREASESAAVAVAAAIAILVLERTGHWLDPSDLIMPLAVLAGGGAAVRFVRWNIATPSDDWNPEPWYRWTPAPLPPLSPLGVTWRIGVMGMLSIVVALAMLWITSTPALSGPDDDVLLHGRMTEGISGVAVSPAGDRAAIGGDDVSGGFASLDAVLRRFDAQGGHTAVPTQIPMYPFTTADPRLALSPLDDRTAITWTEPPAAEDRTRATAAVGHVAVVDNGGNDVWSDAFGHPGNVFLLSAPVALPDGGFAVAGGTTAPLADEVLDGEGDAFVRVYAPDGTVRWTRHLGTHDRDGATAVAVDASGNLYVVGGSYGELQPGGTGAFVVSLDASGSERWSRQFGEGPSDVALGVAVDTDGAPIVTWGTPVPGGHATVSLVTAFDPTGELRWQYAEPDPTVVLDGVALVDGRPVAWGCGKPTLFGIELLAAFGVVIELDNDGSATARRELGSPDGACITSAAADGDRLLVGGRTGTVAGADGGFVVSLGGW